MFYLNVTKVETSRRINKMPDAKIGFTIGGITFSGEGEEKWLSEQLDKFIGKAPELLKITPIIKENEEKPENNASSSTKKQDSNVSLQTLPNFLKSNNATTNQTIKFLATAIWLHAKGNNRLSTNEVTKTLKDSNQSSLGNASECLRQNVTKGYIERDGKQFFVTDEGRTSLSKI
jgi:hypothetical protein